MKKLALLCIVCLVFCLFAQTALAKRQHRKKRKPLPNPAIVEVAGSGEVYYLNGLGHYFQSDIAYNVWCEKLEPLCEIKILISREVFAEMPLGKYMLYPKGTVITIDHQSYYWIYQWWEESEIFWRKHLIEDWETLANLDSDLNQVIVIYEDEFEYLPTGAPVTLPFPLSICP